MMTRPGKLRHRVVLQYPSQTQSEGTQVATWTQVTADIPAEVLAVGGGERIRGKQIEAGIDTVVIVRYGLDKNSDYQWSEHRFVYDSRNLNIVRAVDEEGTRRFFTCYCKEVA